MNRETEDTDTLLTS